MARITINPLAPYVLTLATAFFVFAASHGSTAQAQVPGSCATPVAERISEVGCYVDANEPLGELPTEPIFWHIYNFPTRMAADSAKPLHGTVIESFGNIRLYAIAISDWHPKSGERVAVIGPLVVLPGKQYTARYMEATFTPGSVGIIFQS